MDIYEYLKMDHKKVAKLFDLYVSAQTERNKLEIFELINKELTLHADAEAATFYKTLQTDRNSIDEALHGEKEHDEIKNKLTEIVRFKTINPTMEKKILELKKLVEHHVADEEGRIFTAAKKVLTEVEALELKEQMHDYKEKMLHSEETQQLENV